MFTFSYFGDEADNNLEDNDSNGADTGRQEKFDKSGNRVRGRDREWINKKKYLDPESFKSSEFLKDIKNNFSCKSKKEMEYGDVHLYVCKFSRRKNYEKCSRQVRVIFPADSMEVLIQETGLHEHVEKQGSEGLVSTSLFMIRVLISSTSWQMVPRPSPVHRRKFSLSVKSADTGRD